MAIKINLGCGKDIKKGYINIDIKKEKGVDLVCDISEKRLPFDSNSVDEIYASHMIEHVYDFEKVMKELYRVLKKGGLLKIKVPHFSSARAFYPGHRLFFNFGSFAYLCRGWESNNIQYTQIFSRLKKVKINFLKGWHLENYLIEKLVNIGEFTRCAYEDTFLRSIFPAKEVEVEIEK